MSPERAAKVALEDLFEPAVSIAVWGIDCNDEALLPGELELVEPAVEKRRTEFARGRSCARTALVGAGGRPVPIGAGSHREPLFPADFVGSITHCAGLVAAVVADRSVVSGIGVDAEERQRLSGDVLDMILTDADRATIGTLTPLSTDEAACVLFSAKEALFKATFPMTGIWLGFQDVGLVVSGSSYAVGWTGPDVCVPALSRLEGRWCVTDDHALTGCWVP